MITATITPRGGRRSKRKGAPEARGPAPLGARRMGRAPARSASIPSRWLHEARAKRWSGVLGRSACTRETHDHAHGRRQTASASPATRSACCAACSCITPIAEGTAEARALVNPRHRRALGTRTAVDEEGCLFSLGRAVCAVPVERNVRLSVDAQDENGEPVHVNAENLEGAHLQHEDRPPRRRAERSIAHPPESRREGAGRPCRPQPGPRPLSDRAGGSPRRVRRHELVGPRRRWSAWRPTPGLEIALVITQPEQACGPGGASRRRPRLRLAATALEPSASRQARAARRGAGRCCSATGSRRSPSVRLRASFVPRARLLDLLPFVNLPSLPRFPRLGAAWAAPIDAGALYGPGSRPPPSARDAARRGLSMRAPWRRYERFDGRAMTTMPERCTSTPIELRGCQPFRPCAARRREAAGLADGCRQVG